MFKLITFVMGIFSQYDNIYSQELCLGDIDNDLLVDVNDLLGVLSNFGMGGDIIEDIDMNGQVDVNDILSVLSNYGTECNNVIYPEDPDCVLGNDCGNQIWTECGTSCPLICGSPEPMICNMMCNVGYQCPHNLWWDGETGNCVDPESCSDTLTLPPDIAIGRPFMKETKNIIANFVYENNDWNLI
jgi:hypothetical protein|tara:strand:- start:290 stop:847 length:558 start_codon:yes stop_codon:yes gene_type:complete